MGILSDKKNNTSTKKSGSILSNAKKHEEDKYNKLATIKPSSTLDIANRQGITLPSKFDFTPQPKKTILSKILDANKFAGDSLRSADAGALNTMTFGISDKITKKYFPKVSADVKEVQKNHPIANKVGEIAGYAVPYGGVEAGVAKVGGKVLSKVTSNLGKRAIIGSTAGAIVGSAEATIKGENLKNIGKNTALGGVMGLGGELAIAGVGKAAKGILSKLKNKRSLTAAEEATIKANPKEFKAAQDTLKTENNTTTPKTITKAANGTQQVKSSILKETKKPIVIENIVNKVSVLKGRELPKQEPIISTTIQKATIPQRGKINGETISKSRTLYEPVSTSKLMTGSKAKEILAVNEPSVKSFDNIDATTLKDTSGFNAYTNDVSRIFKKVFGKDFNVAKKTYLDPFDAAKGANADMQANWLNSMKKDVVDKFNIKKGSKESAAVQWFGEKKKLVGTEIKVDPTTGKKSKIAKMIPYTLDDLKADFPTKWESIVEADKWFRTHYDDAIDQINASRKQIYPKAEQNVAEWAKTKTDLEATKGTMSKDAYNSAMKEINIKIEDAMRGKLVPKRNDYYRHFRELQDTVTGVKNLFDTTSQINPSLAGTSDYTKPKSKWASLMQRRGMGQYKADAVGGFIEYTKPASYAINIDPQIQKFRGLKDELAVQTNDSKNLNNFIEYLGDFSDSLAGKTGHLLDRGVQKVIGRKAMNILNWGNSRVKSNTVLGNVSSSLSQIANIPQGIAYVKNPKQLAQGAVDTIEAFLGKVSPMKDSSFLKERYIGKVYSQFDHKIIEQPKKFAAWLLGVGDEIGTKFMWNSVYRKGIAEGVENAIKNADDVTRGLVAGRGIGEVPLMQQEKIFQLIAPFQLEVGNLWRVMGDRVKAKDFGGLATILVANYMLNRGLEEVRGSGVTFDPIRAVEQALSPDKTNLFQKGYNLISKGELPNYNKDTTPLQKAGRLGGEVLSNIPLGQTLANQFPDVTKQKYFGNEDPTRYGTGLTISKGIADPLYKLLPSFGGTQIKKTMQGLSAVKDKGVMNGDKLKYPVQQTPSNTIKGALFGKGGLQETKDYYNNEKRDLSAKQTEAFKALVEHGANPQKLYDFKMIQRESQSIEAKMTAIAKNEKLTDDQKRSQIKPLYAEYQKILEQFKNLQK